MVVIVSAVVVVINIGMVFCTIRCIVQRDPTVDLPFVLEPDRDVFRVPAQGSQRSESSYI